MSVFFLQAVDSGCKRSVHFLLDNGANWMEKDTFGNTALECAKKRNLSEIIEMIAEKERQKHTIILDKIVQNIQQNNQIYGGQHLQLTFSKERVEDKQQTSCCVLRKC